ncbi:sensor domain-containing diguanylate cyclase [Aliikangiella coralliicola]|uniref:diguanylate cyclase n=1 Tax=Aliikangiella coralliicola TaxID=2592383 RepID=A0A545UBY9_9GAMM|nr:diguanylate cyclase [Aliikangiella coralliicola]TQV86982.1 diguanylate cyclase [Aliikangiella coralliicola]
MTDNIDQLREFHWMLDMLQNIDAGLIVLNRENEIQAWNSFMENHSGMLSSNVKNKNLFELFPEIPIDWFQHKVESVFQLHTRAFSIWEQRPYIFKFKNYRPITGTADFMFQNISVFPLKSSKGEVTNICIIVYDVTDIATSSQALESANQQLEFLSRTDRLTGLNNRGYWQECQEQEFARFQRHHHSTSLLIFDIDHFKKVNDTYGHQAGDEVIRMCARALLSCAREIDICGRYGGEEFVVLMTDTDSKGANIFAERIRQLIEKLTIEYDTHKINFTVSLGVCELTDSIKSAQQWLELADQGLYQSKQNGRNQTSVYQSK